jgi:uncharacterized domain HDIG
MRKHQIVAEKTNMRILAVDDDLTIALTLQSYFTSSGFDVDVESDPYKAIERVRNTHYDILLTDFLMTPIRGDKVVEAVREFNNDIFIIFLTGHKSLAPPVKTIRALNIQGYFEKSDNFNQLELLIESCVKSIRQLKTIREYQEDLEEINERLLEANAQLKGSHDSLINVLRSAVDARDPYTRGHSDRVAMLAEEISRMLGRSEKDNERTKMAGFFHDIGKIRIPDCILLKEGALSESERQAMQKHPEYAVEILTHVEWFADLIPGVTQHHERYDGKGYPYHLIGEAIHEDARIIALADSFDAMTSFRRYRKNMTVEEAKAEIIAGSGTQFDPAIVAVFAKLPFDTVLMHEWFGHIEAI